MKLKRISYMLAWSVIALAIDIIWFDAKLSLWYYFAMGILGGLLMEVFIKERT